jgi:hypothetical protein
MNEKDVDMAKEKIIMKGRTEGGQQMAMIEPYHRYYDACQTCLYTTAFITFG